MDIVIIVCFGILCAFDVVCFVLLTKRKDMMLTDWLPLGALIHYLIRRDKRA